MRTHSFAVALALLALVSASRATRAETVSMSSIGCDDFDATIMAGQALQDKISGKDHDAMERIRAYQNKAGPDSCRPLAQGDQVTIVRERDDMVCVHEFNARMNGPSAPDCYWMRRRHIKLPQ
jgi:hypothetical protein